MRLLGRLLALFVILSSSGALQGLTAEDPCEEEEQGGDCSTCVVPCACCPVRVIVASRAPVLPVVVLEAQKIIFSALPEPVISASAADIFHPPRA
jgi:hypothetical protein